MFTFSKPRYLNKRVHPVTQKTEPSYLFDVQYHETMTDAPLSLFLETGVELTASHVEEALREEQEWWLTFLQAFLTASASYFSKPYTANHLQRILRHHLYHPASSPSSSSSPSSPSTSTPMTRRVCCVPRILELIGGQLLVHWAYEVYPAGIHIPDEEEATVSVENNEPVVSLSLPASTTEIEEWDVDAVPEEQTTGVLADHTMLLEKQRVKEARLRAKLAVYRAQYQMNRFQNKYGQEVSDSEEEDEDEDEEDEDSFS